MPPSQANIAELWEKPIDIAERDLFYGAWGAELAPDPDATYTFLKKKEHGTNPGVTVLDPDGREWHVKQPAHTVQGDEGPTEVVLSRVLSAVGYHQPPVYFLRSLTVKDTTGTHVEPGGRFRLKEKSLKSIDSWSWQRNPFVGTRPYAALLVILEAFGSHAGVRLARKHVSWYSRGLPGSAEFLAAVNRLADADTVLGLIGQFYDRLIARGASRAMPRRDEMLAEAA